MAQNTVWMLLLRYNITCQICCSGMGSPRPFPGFQPRAGPDQTSTPLAAPSSEGSSGATPGSGGGLLAATSVFIRSLSPFATLPAPGVHFQICFQTSLAGYPDFIGGTSGQHVTISHWDPANQSLRALMFIMLLQTGGFHLGSLCCQQMVDANRHLYMDRQIDEPNLIRCTFLMNALPQSESCQCFQAICLGCSIDLDLKTWFDKCCFCTWSAIF